MEAIGFEPDQPLICLMGHLNIWQLGVMLPGFTMDNLRRLDRHLRPWEARRAGKRARPRTLTD